MTLAQLQYRDTLLSRRFPLLLYSCSAPQLLLEQNVNKCRRHWRICVTLTLLLLSWCVDMEGNSCLRCYCTWPDRWKVLKISVWKSLSTAVQVLYGGVSLWRFFPKNLHFPPFLLFFFPAYNREPFLFNQGIYLQNMQLLDAFGFVSAYISIKSHH